MHPVNLSTAVTHARDFKATKLEANHAQAVNLVINRSSNLDSKLKQFSDNINQKLENYLADNRVIYQPLQQRNDLGNANLLLIDLEEEKLKPTWEVYQASWADVDHNELPPILTWDDDNNGKEEQRKEPICRTTIDT
ncbi:hypothetical protein G9A89_022562 [Geosiphon pyriformis]|nr:hypothetical protein G9A89_022562 [Geosiphon pyriformis]